MARNFNFTRLTIFLFDVNIITSKSLTPFQANNIDLKWCKAFASDIAEVK